MSGPAAAQGEGGAPGRLRLLYVAPVLVFAALAGLFGLRLVTGVDPSRVPSVLVGRPVPAFALEGVPGLARDGRPVPGLAAGDLNGRVSVVNVWASWCGPCQVEHPLLMRLAEDSALRVVGINYKDNPENARRFLGRHGNPFAAVGVDAGGRTAIEWGVTGVPETFVVGPDGRVRHRHVGPLTEAALDDIRRHK